MSLDRAYCFQRLDTLWQRDDIPVLELANDTNYILFSDLHLGNGRGADDFHENEETLVRALGYYLDKKNFKLILAGDIEELWQFGLEEIRSRYYTTVYSLLRAFGDENVYRIFGNHDGDWNSPFIDSCRVNPVQSGIATEALKIGHANDKPFILVCHGHQGDIHSDREAGISRLVVRAYRHFEPAIRMKKPRFLRSNVIKSYERTYYQWAKSRDKVIICGHSHRAIFASISFLEKREQELSQVRSIKGKDIVGKEGRRQNKQRIRELKKSIRREKRLKRKITSVEDGRPPRPIYFNTGCGIYDSGITGIELSADKIRLVKWNRDPGLPSPVIYGEQSL